MGQNFAKYPNADVVDIAFDGAIAVDIGDLMWHDSNDAKPAWSQADQGSEAANQAYFAPRFLGVAKERKVTTDAAGTIAIARTWVGTITCVSSTFEAGDLVAPCENGDGVHLDNQRVKKTTDPRVAIGRVLRRYAAAVTTILVELTSRVIPPQRELKFAYGQHTTVAAVDTVVTGLASLVTVVAQFDSDPGDDPNYVSASIGDQAGSPAAGSFYAKTWKNTGGTDPTPAAATTFSKKVNWVALGY